MPREAIAAVASSDPDKPAEDFANLRELVEGDYLAGRIVIVDGWIMSEHEAARLADLG